MIPQPLCREPQNTDGDVAVMKAPVPCPRLSGGLARHLPSLLILGATL